MELNKYLTPSKTSQKSWIRWTTLPLILILTTSCSIFQPKQVEVVSKPIEIEIIQPTMPRNIELNEPHWYVVSEAVISNPCIKDVETGKREKNEDGSCKNGKENPDWPEGYTYLDQFIDEMKKMNSGDVVFVAMTVADYELMAMNMQELRRYIREVQEVVVYYRNVTIKDQPAVGAEIIKK